MTPAIVEAQRSISNATAGDSWLIGERRPLVICADMPVEYFRLERAIDVDPLALTMGC